MIYYVLENAINVFGGFKATLGDLYLGLRHIGYTFFLPKMVTNLLELDL